jgi:hypothetical protein
VAFGVGVNKEILNQQLDSKDPLESRNISKTLVSGGLDAAFQFIPGGKSLISKYSVGVLKGLTKFSIKDLLFPRPVYAPSGNYEGYANNGVGWGWSGGGFGDGGSWGLPPSSGK